MPNTPSFFETVEAYSGFGYHRTGSPSDTLTAEWLADSLSASGARVSSQAFDFRYFAFTSDVIIDDTLVESLPLYYEWLGHLESRTFRHYAIDGFTDDNRIGAQLAVIRRDSVASDCIKLITTDCPTGDVVALNAIPRTSVGSPTLLVPANLSERLEFANAQMSVQAYTQPACSHNLIATFGPADANPLVITTPSTGWFQCAGERGTGLALAISLAQRLSEYAPIAVVITSGHELGYLGGWHHTRTRASAPRGVLHIGSCVACADSAIRTDEKTHSNLVLTSNLPEESSRGLLQAVAPLGVDTLKRPAAANNHRHWLGESECWAHFACPMISLAGDSPQFHTPSDIAPVTTSEDLLSASFHALLGLGRSLVQSIK